MKKHLLGLCSIVAMAALALASAAAVATPVDYGGPQLTASSPTADHGLVSPAKLEAAAVSRVSLDKAAFRVDGALGTVLHKGTFQLLSWPPQEVVAEPGFALRAHRWRLAT